jgi:hypothetical protein
MITKKYFDVALEKVKPSLTDEILMDSVNRASVLLYSENERRIIQEAFAVVKHAKIRDEDYSQLRKATLYSSKMDFIAIKKLTDQLKKKLDKKGPRQKETEEK